MNDALACDLAKDMFAFGARLMRVVQRVFHNIG